MSLFSSFDTNSPGYQDFSVECPLCKKAGKFMRYETEELDEHCMKEHKMTWADACAGTKEVTYGR